MKKPPSFFVAEALDAGRLVLLPEEERRHARARRMRTGARVRVIDGTGRIADGVVERLNGSALQVRIEEVRSPGEAGFALTLLAPVLRFTRLSWLIEKATELGATRIVLVATSRAQGDRVEFASKDRARLERIAREASKQSERLSFPRIEGPVSFSEAVASGAASRLLLDPDGEAFPVSLPGESAALWIGPEGGFSPDEILAAEIAGWKKARLPGGLLRAETAVLAALALTARAIDSTRARADNSSNR